jgi:hypothetical protein
LAMSCYLRSLYIITNFNNNQYRWSWLIMIQHLILFHQPY